MESTDQIDIEKDLQEIDDHLDRINTLFEAAKSLKSGTRSDYVSGEEDVLEGSHVMGIIDMIREEADSLQHRLSGGGETQESSELPAQIEGWEPEDHPEKNT